MSFQPSFLFPDELVQYGLPDASEEPNIFSYIADASTTIDQYCGRQDTDGNGSLIWTTYTERIYLPEGRNIFRLSFRPMIGIPIDVFNAYAASATAGITAAETYLTAGNSEKQSDGVTLSPIVSAKGRYGYGRRAQQQVYPDLNYGANILQIASYFGGPPQFTPITISNTDVDPRSGEVWVPAGLYLSAYTEVMIQYNAGWDPLNLPANLKRACAMVVKNFLSRPAGGLKGFGVGKVHHEFTDMYIDPTTDRLLQPFKTIMAA